MPLTSPRRSRLTAAAGALLAAGVAGGLLATPASAAPPADADYIVVLRDTVAHPSDVAAEHRRNYGAQVSHTYGSALKGYAARLSGRAYADIVSDKRVAYVERDGMAYPTATQAGATWGLDRIDQRDRPLSTTYTYTATGAVVNAYVIDSGIRKDHVDLAGRVSAGMSFVAGKETDTGDCNGHGTHVAGTIGGTTWGVAKQVNLVPVRVFDCTGGTAWSTVISAVDWVTVNAAKPAVANMSLGGGASSAVDTAVKNSITSGVTYAVSAGNSGQDACRQSPARVAPALTVGATDMTDRKASFSNFGKCVDLFAPGVDITSAWSTASDAVNTISGTSMAAPHVAGVAALFLTGSPAALPAEVASALVTSASMNKLSSIGRGSPNQLLFTAY